MNGRIVIAGLGAALLVAGCNGSSSDTSSDPMRLPPGADGADDAAADDGVDDGADDGADDGDGGTSNTVPLDATQVRLYLGRIAPYLAGRSLTYEEGVLIDEIGEDAIYDILEAWVETPGFGDSIRYFIQTQLNASGAANGVDYELPGNLAYEIATLDLPWSNILTADYCVDAEGQHIECDTGAPYAAGVLATKAYLIPNKGRFNLSRAKLMLESFACRIYPMEHDIQPPLEKDILIPMFQAENAAEQTVPEAQGGFGNGQGCYTCHSQFGAHAQLFVRFDDSGNYHPEATGRQDPDNELGRSIDGLYTSHFEDPATSGIEASQIFGESVANLSEAADVVTSSRLFRECTVKNLIAHPFGLEAGFSEAIDETLLARLTDDVESVDPDATVAEYVLEIFTDDEVVRTTIASLENG